jgi:hypothetical protein
LDPKIKTLNPKPQTLHLDRYHGPDALDAPWRSAVLPPSDYLRNQLFRPRRFTSAVLLEVSFES